MSRLSALTLVLTVLVAACSPFSSRSGDKPEEPTSSSVVADAADDRLVVATTAGSIVVHTSDAAEVTRFDPATGMLFRNPTWIDAETVVFSEVDGSGGGALIAGDASTGRVVWRAKMDTSPFYYSPSPPGAPFATTSLRNNPSGGLITEFVDADGNVTSLSNDSPVYTSWSPDGSSLASHVAQSSLSVFADSKWGEILSPTGTFQAPSWTDHGLVTLRTVGGEQRLSVWRNGAFDDVVVVEGPAGFVVAGTRVAIFPTSSAGGGGISAALRIQNLQTLRGERLSVVDLDDGSTEFVSAGPVVLFQWDTAGERLLYATVDGDAGNARLGWSIWEGGESMELASHRTQVPWARDLLPFQDQYAQSVRLWSPSGSHIAFPATVDGSRVVAIRTLDGSTEVLVPDAVWVSWAPRVDA